MPQIMSGTKTIGNVPFVRERRLRKSLRGFGHSWPFNLQRSLTSPISLMGATFFFCLWASAIAEPIISQQLCIKDQICAQKCCPIGYVLDEISMKCEVTGVGAAEVETSRQDFFICPEGESLNKVTQQTVVSNSSRSIVCIEDDVRTDNDSNRTAYTCLSRQRIHEIRLQKCCPTKHVIYDGDCIEVEDSDKDGDRVKLPVFAVESNASIELETLVHFSSTFDDHCPDGGSLKFYTNFTVYEDSTTQIKNLSLRFDRREFCIDRLFRADFEQKEKYVAGFCSADKSNYTDEVYVRKCCAPGHALNSMNKCVPVDHKFAVPWKNTSGYPVRFPPDSYALESGRFFTCPPVFKKFLLRPAVTARDEFYILESGNLYLPITEIESNHYCMDHLIVENTSVSWLFQLQP